MVSKRITIFSPILFPYESTCQNHIPSLGWLSIALLSTFHALQGAVTSSPGVPTGHHSTSRLAPCSAWCCSYLGPPFLAPRVYKWKLLDLGALVMAHLGDVKPQCLRWACLQKIQHSLPCFLTTPCLRSQGWWETRETENRLFTLWHWAPWHVLVQFSSVQSLSRVQLFVIPWITARQASLSITNSQSLLKLMSIQSVMPSSHLILCRPFLLLPPIPPSIRVFSNESSLRVRWPKYWSFSFNISRSNEHPGLISFRMDWLDLLAVQGTLKSLLQIVQRHQFLC